MQTRINITAGVPVRQEFSGRILMLLDTGAAESVDLIIEVAGFGQESLRGMRRGLKLRTPGFTGVTISAAVDCTVELVATVADIDIDTVDGATVRAQILGTVPVAVTGQPVAVVPDRGAPANPVYVAGITYSDAPATSATNNAAVAVPPDGVVLVAANAARRELRIMNAGPDPVAIGPAAGLAWDKRVIVLDVGDLWVETRGANLAWSAICDAGKAGSVTVQEVLS